MRITCHTFFLLLIDILQIIFEKEALLEILGEVYLKVQKESKKVDLNQQPTIWKFQKQ